MTAKKSRAKLIRENKELRAMKNGLLYEMERILTDKNEIISGLFRENSGLRMALRSAEGREK